MQNKIFRLEPLIEILETAMYTAFIAGENPVSLILVGPSGACKSKLLKAYASPALHYTDSVTSKGLFDIVRSDPLSLKKFLVLPDINPTMARKHETVNATMGNLLSLTADGTVRTDDGRSEKTAPHQTMGVLTACTPEIYERNAKEWFALGLRRRFIPIFYRYNLETTEFLLDQVGKNNIHGSAVIPTQVKFPRPASPLIEDKLDSEIKMLAGALALYLGKLKFERNAVKRWYVREVVPVAPKVVLRTMAMAHALRAKRMKVSDDDLSFLRRFVDFTDMEHPRAI